MSLKESAEREVDRVNAILPAVSALKPKGEDLLAFAEDYASDSKFFLKSKKFVEAFEAAVIAWAYVDIGLKLGLLDVPKKLLENFTV